MKERVKEESQTLTMLTELVYCFYICIMYTMTTEIYERFSVNVVLTLYQTTNFRLVQMESICRRLENMTQKLKFDLGRVKRHCGKWRKCWLPKCCFQKALSLGSLKVGIVW